MWYWNEKPHLELIITIFSINSFTEGTFYMKTSIKTSTKLQSLSGDETQCWAPLAEVVQLLPTFQISQPYLICFIRMLYNMSMKKKKEVQCQLTHWPLIIHIFRKTSSNNNLDYHLIGLIMITPYAFKEGECFTRNFTLMLPEICQKW